TKSDQSKPDTGYSMRGSTLEKQKGSCSTSVEDGICEDNWDANKKYLDHRNETVGLIIKKAKRNSDNRKLSSAKRRILALGLSSILDMGFIGV
ncbi:hypothetical protein BGZ46_002570, partial [Entomortierella lignicola]